MSRSVTNWPSPGALADEITTLLQDPTVQVPARLVQALPGGSSLFVMPAFDARLAIAKLITFTPANTGTHCPAIQGEVIVFDIASGSRVAVLDGPEVTARRTAAVSLLAARRLAKQPLGPLLIVGAGVQGRSHLEAFAQGLGVREVWIASRSADSAGRLAAHGRQLGLQARVVDDADAALAHCPLVVTATSAAGVVLSALPRDDAFIAAIGAFTPHMVELAPRLCRYVAQVGEVVLDTPDARHEAGDLLQAHIDVGSLRTLSDVVRDTGVSSVGPVLFKSCGWAGWDLACARAVIPPTNNPG